MLLIQLLGSQWTKKDRNIEATRERAAAPTVLSFQTPQLPEFGECWVQSTDVRRIDWTDRVVAEIVEVLRLDTETLRVGLSAEIGIANSVALGVISQANLRSEPLRPRRPGEAVYPKFRGHGALLCPIPVPIL